MRVPTIYLDTSVIGGYHDVLWMQDTRELWQQRESGLWRFISSGLVAQEVADAPPEVPPGSRKPFLNVMAPGAVAGSSAPQLKNPQPSR